MNKKILAAACTTIYLFATLPAQAGASDPSLIGNYGSWKAYSFTDKSGKVCVMNSQPQKQEGNFKKRSQVFFFVTHWPGGKDKNVVKYV
jgi:hypothetical protein